MTEASASTAAAQQSVRRRGRIRSISYYAVLVVAGILLLLSTFAIWVNRVALNTSSSSRHEHEPDAERPDPTGDRHAGGRRPVRVGGRPGRDPEAAAEGREVALRPGERGAAPGGVHDRRPRALQQPAVQRLFAQSLEEAHQTLVQVLEGGGPNVSTENGVVTLNLHQIILDAADRIGIGEQVADKVPAERRPDRDPPLGPAERRAERLRAPEDARLAPAHPHAPRVRARLLARRLGSPPQGRSRHRRHDPRRRRTWARSRRG